MRIAFANINCNRRDGSARAVNEVAERLAAKWEVHLFARKAEDLDLGRVRWHHVPGPSWPEVVDFASYHIMASRALAKSRFDVVHSIGCNVAGANVITIQNVQPAKREVLKGLGHIEGVGLTRRLSRWLYLELTSAAEKKLYTHRPARRPPLFLPVSRGVETELRTHYDIGTAPTRIVPNGADADKFRPLPAAERESWRARHGFSEKDVVMIFSGGEWARKGLDLAICALAVLKCPSVKLFVAGDDPNRERFSGLAIEMGVKNKVVFGGFRRDIAEALASCDLFLFPSHYEAFSLATIEAASCGLPIIASKINGAEDFVRSGVTGEFVEHSAPQIASVLGRWVRDAELRRVAGEEARRAVKAKYTWDRVAKLTEEAYLEYLADQGR